jgi:hypothetical protein
MNPGRSTDQQGEKLALGLRPQADDPRVRLDGPRGQFRHGHRLPADAVARGHDDVAAIVPAPDGPHNGFCSLLVGLRPLDRLDGRPGPIDAQIGA